MNLIDDAISQYAEQHSQAEDAVLYQLYRETNLKETMPQMLSGHLQGLVLKMFSSLIKPKNVLEIGTFTGYSAICLAEGLQKDGLLYSIEISGQREELIHKYWQQAGIANNAKLLIGNALDILPTLDLKFDLVFIDADKINYSNYYQLLIDKLPKDAVILVDNVLWSGKVIDESATDKDTIAIRAFNDLVQNDDRVENILLPIRDGIMYIKKR